MATRRSRRQDFDKKISKAKDKRMQTYYEVYNVLKKDAGGVLPHKVKGEGFDALVAKKLKKETGAALNADEKAAIKKLTGFDDKKDFIKYKYGMNQGGSVKMKAKGYRKGGAPMGMKKPGNEIVRPGKKSPKLSSAQENLLRQAQSYAKETGQNPAEVKRLTGMYGDLNAAKEANMSAAKGVKKARRQAGVRGTGPRRMNMGGAAIKTKGYAKGGAAMKTKGAAKGGVRKPSSSKSGLYGRR